MNLSSYPLTPVKDFTVLMQLAPKATNTIWEQALREECPGCGIITWNLAVVTGLFLTGEITVEAVRSGAIPFYEHVYGHPGRHGWNAIEAIQYIFNVPIDRAIEQYSAMVD